jgi:Spy/CpxP family protein refolding chaperone
MKRRHKSGDRRAELRKELHLTPEQVQKIKTIRDEARNASKGQMETAQATAKAFREALTSNVSDDELRRLHTKMLDARRELMKSRFEGMLKIRQLLTPEQREKFQQLRGRGLGESRRGR